MSELKPTFAALAVKPMSLPPSIEVAASVAVLAKVLSAPALQVVATDAAASTTSSIVASSGMSSPAEMACAVAFSVVTTAFFYAFASHVDNMSNPASTVFKTLSGFAERATSTADSTAPFNEAPFAVRKT